MLTILKRAGDWGVNALLPHIILSPVTWAFVISVGAGVIAMLRSELIIILAVGTFCLLLSICSILTILTGNAYLLRVISPKYKLVLRKTDPIVGYNNEQFTFCPRLKVQNLGNFPIEIDYSELEWSVNGYSGFEKIDNHKRLIIQPKTIEILEGPTYLVQEPPDDKSVILLQTDINAVIRYGRLSQLKFVHIVNYRLSCVYKATVDLLVWLDQIHVKRLA